MKTFLVAALFAASAAIASPPPTKAPTDTRPPPKATTGTLEEPTGDDIQADPNAPTKTGSKAEAEPELKASGRAETVLKNKETTGAQQKPLKKPAPATKNAQ